MQHFNELTTILNQHFHWHKSKMDCFVAMLIALFKQRSINLDRLASAFPHTETEKDSRYRRIQRFIHHHPIDFDQIALFIIKLFGFDKQSFYLILDRSNWKWGKIDINILMLAISYKSVAIPIYWLLLNKKGNSNTKERIVLVSRFIKKFSKNNVLGILADREFVGETWLKWLKSELIDIPFHIRIKKNAKVPGRGGELVQAHKLFRYLPKGEVMILKGAKKMTGVEVYLTGLRLENNELLIVASSYACTNAIETYGKRWQIETLFGCLKSRGFNMEDTRLTKMIRIKRLLVVPVIAFCWAHRSGEWKNEHVKSVKFKKHKRPAKSWFKYGLDWLTDALSNTLEPIKFFCEIILQLFDFKKLYFES